MSVGQLKLPAALPGRTSAAITFVVRFCHLRTLTSWRPLSIAPGLLDSGVVSGLQPQEDQQSAPYEPQPVEQRSRENAANLQGWLLCGRRSGNNADLFLHHPELLDDADDRSKGTEDGIVRGAEHVRDGRHCVHDRFDGLKGTSRRF